MIDFFSTLEHALEWVNHQRRTWGDCHLASAEPLRTTAATPTISPYYCQSFTLNSPYHINNTSNTVTAATQQSYTMISNSNNTDYSCHPFWQPQFCQHWSLPHERISCSCSMLRRALDALVNNTWTYHTMTLARI